MPNRVPRDPGGRNWRRLPTPSIVVAGAAVFIALSGSAVAATSLIGTRDIATGAVTSAKIRNGAIALGDLNATTQRSLRGRQGDTGVTGTPGTPGASGSNGANGPNGANGIDGSDGLDGSNGAAGTNGTNGADGILGPLSATAGLTALPTATPPTVVVSLAVPAGNYVVFAKTQLSHTGAGDSVDCTLKAGTTTIDQVAMKTLPALAAIPVSLQAVTTTSPSQLSVECDVLTANGSANFSSLIALPVG